VTALVRPFKVTASPETNTILFWPQRLKIANNSYTKVKKNKIYFAKRLKKWKPLTIL